MPFRTSPFNRYSGTARNFIKSYVIPNLPTASALLSAHQNLEDYLRSNSNYIIRKTADHSMRGQWSNGTGGGYRFIVSDNEPAVWSYMQTFLGEVPNFSENIQQQAFPIAFALKRKERDNADWTNSGRSHREFSSVGLKHCHIAPCSPRGAPLRTQEDFKRRMLALLSPMNHFLFPGPRRHHMPKDWGEDKKFIELLTYLVAKEHYNPEQIANFATFLSYQGMTLPDREPADFDISYEPRAASEPDRIDMYNAKIAVGSNQDSKILELEAYIDATDPYYAIEKNTAGTAHEYEIFVANLRNWLEHTDQDTLCNEDYNYGGAGWLFCRVGGEVLRLNRDTRRTGVKAFLDALDITPAGLDVIYNRLGRCNLVVPRSVGEQIPYFYFYLYLDTDVREQSEPLIHQAA